MDAGYDSVEMHTLVFEKLHSKPVIQLRPNAVMIPAASKDNKSLIKFDVIGYRGDTQCIYAVLHS